VVERIHLGAAHPIMGGAGRGGDDDHGVVSLGHGLERLRDEGNRVGGGPRARPEPRPVYGELSRTRRNVRQSSGRTSQPACGHGLMRLDQPATGPPPG
jgi:hypothetical protein